MSEMVHYDPAVFEDSITNSSVISNDAASISYDIQQFLDVVDDRILGYYDQDITSKLTNYSTTFDNDSDNMQQFGRWLNDTYDGYKATVAKVNDIVSNLETNEIDGKIEDPSNNPVDVNWHDFQSKTILEEEKTKEEKEEQEDVYDSIVRQTNGNGTKGNHSEEENKNGIPAGIAAQASSAAAGGANGNNAGLYASLVGMGLAQAIEGVDAIAEDAKDSEEGMDGEISEDEKMKSGPGTTEEEEQENKNDNMLLGMGVGLAAAALTGKFVLSDDDDDEDEEKAIEKYMSKEK